ncbi:hypothetical protein ACFL43_06350 [Thermodesulfobacteriota bacterium]
MKQLARLATALLIAAALCAAAGCDDEEPDEAVKPAALAYPVLYSADSPFNQPIAGDAAIDPDSDLLIESIIEQAESQGFFIAVNEWTIPIYYADADTPRYDVALTASWAPARVMLDVPIPDYAEPDPAGDGHMVIIDNATGCEYDLWVARKGISDSWSASWGNAISHDGNGIFPTGLSARGSGFALPAGMLWPGELAAGEITHALVFSYDHTKAGGPVAPATESDGTSLRDDAIPEGARIQLDPDLDLSALGLTDYELTIAKALQRYGMFLGDDGGGVQLQAVSPLSVQGNPYDGILPDDDTVLLDNIPVERFRVLKLPPQEPDIEVTLSESDCAQME